MSAEAKLIAAINEELSDLETGPLSDMQVVDIEVDEEGMLELWGPSDVSFASQRLDTPQLARALLARWPDLGGGR